MTWIKLDDKCARHPKIAGLSDRAFRVWVQALCYSSEFLTDGLLPPVFLRGVPVKVRGELVASGLWEVADEQVRIHDYLGHQAGRADVERERERQRQRRTGGQPSDNRRTTAVQPPVVRDQIQIQIQRTDPEGTTKNVVPRVGGGGLLMSPAQFAKARQSHAYVGERLSVPHVLHDELRRKLGGDDPEAALRAWYAGLDAELLTTKEPVPDVFAFVRPKFADWAQGQANEREMARFLAGEV